jgi:hypothetical protein
MRLSEFAAAAKAPAAVAPNVLATLTPILVALGAGEDPEGWLTWIEEAADRWTFLAPTAAGLVTCHVRVNVPGEGPRTSAKVSRWSRVQVGELSMESTPGGHRVASFQLDSAILRGGDADADIVAAFALAVFAAMDGRPTVAS